MDFDRFRPILGSLGLIWIILSYFEDSGPKFGQFLEDFDPFHFRDILRALGLDLASFRGF